MISNYELNYVVVKGTEVIARKAAVSTSKAFQDLFGKSLKCATNKAVKPTGYLTVEMKQTGTCTLWWFEGGRVTEKVEGFAQSDLSHYLQQLQERVAVVVSESLVA